MALAMGNVVDGISFDIFVSPLRPAFASKAREQFKIGSWRTRFDDVVNFVRLSRMLALSRRKRIHLSSARFQRSHASANTEQNELCYVAKIKSDSAPIRSAVFTNLEPNDVGFVC